MKHFYRLFYVVLLSCCFLQCRKEHAPGNSTKQDTHLAPSPVTADLQGTVQDENNQPSAGVKVTAGDKTAVTDASGYFRITGAALDKNASLACLEKDGYFKTYREFSATPGVNQLSVKLTTKSLAGILPASSGGDITLTDGAKISLPANSVVIASSGAAYSGNISVYAWHADPRSGDAQAIVAGSFVAEVDGKLAAASSFGMLTVELESAAGEKLQLKTGVVAAIATPISPAALAAAPSTLSLSHLDEVTGIWKADGVATRQGSYYTGTVAHFSNWNYNDAYNGVSITMTLSDPNGSPLAGVLAQISTASGALIPVTANTLGQIKAMVPANEALVLTVRDECSQTVFTENISGLSKDSDIGTLTVSSSSAIVTFKGKLVDCTGAAVKNGIAHFVINGYMHRVAQTNPDGSFSYTWVNCSAAGTTVNVLGTDETALQKSVGADFSITGPVTDFGTISVCGSSAQQFISYKLDGKTYDLVRSTTQNDSLSAYTTVIRNVPLTSVSGGNSANTARISFGVKSASATGTYPVSQLSINGYSGIVLTQPFNVTFTNFPDAPGGFYEGALSGQFKANGEETLHEINLTFKVLR